MFHLRSQLKMGSALIDLSQLLLSKKEQEQITLQEVNLMMKWQSQTLRNSMIGFSGAAIVSMLVTPRRLNIFIRGSLSFGASIVCALWNFGRSLESWNDHFLSLEGSRMQSELANIMLKRYKYDPWVLQRLSKHFYLEEVYEDSLAEKPKFMWRSRYFYEDPTSDFQNTLDNEKTDSSKNDVEKTTAESKEVNVNAAADDSQNPFDFVFGLPGSAENIPNPKTSSTSPGSSSLRERRSRRRHRRRHQEDSDV